MTGDEMRDARRRLGMSQSAMAAALRLKKGDRTIRRMERGEVVISGPVELAVEAMLERQEGSARPIKESDHG